MWQRICSEPAHHDLFLTALFGTFSWDTLDKQNPWALQLSSDLRALQHHEGFDYINEEVLAQPFLLLQRRDLAAHFVKADLSILRADFRAVVIPPPGYDFHDPVHEPPIGIHASQERLFVCDCALGDGKVCGKSFDSFQKLLMHQRRSSSCYLPFQQTLSSLVLTNQCPWCCTVFSSRTSACHHVIGAFLSGTCRTDRSYIVPPVAIPHDICCALCGVQCSTLDAYNWHIRGHLAPEAIELGQDVPDI
eukprot:2629331-Amphidinium_carterae.1